jgi:transcriptional regulator with XRE-family HTH domain
MNTLEERFDQALLRAKKSTSQRKIAAILNVSPQTVTAIKQGVIRIDDYLHRIAEQLQVAPDWLLTGDESSAPSWVDRQQVAFRDHGSPQLALVGHTSAGDGEIYQEFPEPLAFPVPPDWVVVRVDGDSAYPVVYAGQFVVLDTRRTQSAATLDAAAIHDLNNNICMVRTTSGRSLLKRLCEAFGSPDGFTLASVNAGLSSPWLARQDIDTVTPVVGVIYEDPAQERQKGRVSAPRHKGVN